MVGSRASNDEDAEVVDASWIGAHLFGHELGQRGAAPARSIASVPVLAQTCLSAATCLADVETARGSVEDDVDEIG